MRAFSLNHVGRIGLVVSCLAGAPGAFSAEAALSTNRLEMIASLELEDILNVKVTSVSKRPEKLFEASAAVSVITAEDIRRSGSRSIVEAMRLAPGVFVGQMDSSTWAVGVRGLADRYANSLLVLVDGRSVYTSSFGGVYWESLNYLLEDIDRIEVIRGPGGSLYGDNAVNGVVNIITKNASETEGVYATGGAGTLERGFGGARYGLRLGEHGFARGYVDYSSKNNFPGGSDEWSLLQGGLRSDWSVGPNQFTLQGDKYVGRLSQTLTLPTFADPWQRTIEDDHDISGQNVLARWTHEFNEESDLRLQAYYDKTRLAGAIPAVEEKYDIDFQHRFELPWRQKFMYGLGYRYYPNEKPPVPSIPEARTYNPSERHWQLFSSFLQDEITLIEDRLRLTLGSKIEHWDTVGWQFQPNARAAWLITPRQTLWTAVSRSVLVPSDNARDVLFNPLPAPVPPQMQTITGVGTFPILLRGGGNPEVDATELLAYELGYRIQVVESLSVDAAAFYFDYNDRISGEIGAAGLAFAPSPHISVPISAANNASAYSYGGELSLTYRPVDRWRLTASYSALELKLSDPLRPNAVMSDPQHQFSIWSSLDLPANFNFDLWGRHVSDIPQFNVKSYYDLDARLAWLPAKNLELAIVGQNLIETSHFEYGQQAFIKSKINPAPRAVYAQVTVRF